MIFVTLIDCRLAILGESAVAKASEVSSLTHAGFLPRLLPAPQALLRVVRQDRLRTTPAKVIGIHSGNFCDSLGLIPRLMLDPAHADSDKHFVQSLRITKAEGRTPLVQAAKFRYMTFLAITSFLGWVGLLAYAIILRDGMAVLALVLLGLVSSTTHILLYHKIELPPWNPTRPFGDLPKSDLVIQHPKGAFQIIECEEEIARRIFLHPETCDYWIKDERIYRLLAMPATLALMVGAICLSNAKSELQLYFACALVSLNAAHWFVAAQKEEVHWDWSSIKVEETKRSNSNNYLNSLWEVIYSTGSTRWVKAAKIAPDNQAWDEWIIEAQKQLTPENRPVNEKGIVQKSSWDPHPFLTAALKRLKEAADQVPLQSQEVNEQAKSKHSRESSSSDGSEAIAKPENAELR